MPGRQVVIIGEVYDPTLSAGMPLPPGSPPGIWGGAPIPWPTPPIYYPPSAPVDPGYGIPGPPYPPHPAHPIVPGSPPGIWGGPIKPGDPSWEGQPGQPAHPIVIPPVYPAHPIVIPPGPDQPPPDGNGDHPAHPIVIPPDVPPNPDASHVLMYVSVYAPVSGQQKGVWLYVEVPPPPTVPEPKPTKG